MQKILYSFETELYELSEKNVCKQRQYENKEINTKIKKDLYIDKWQKRKQ
jgi:hypothetical protein